MGQRVNSHFEENKMEEDVSAFVYSDVLPLCSQERRSSLKKYIGRKKGGNPFLADSGVHAIPNRSCFFL